MGLIILLFLLYIFLCILSVLPIKHISKGLCVFFFLVSLVFTPLVGFILSYMFVNCGCYSYDDDYFEEDDNDEYKYM